MAKLSIRSDGTCYTRAAVSINGSKQPRTFEIDPKGKKWLAERGICRDEQEIPRKYVSYLFDLGWIYTAGKRPATPKVTIRKIAPETQDASDRMAQTPRDSVTPGTAFDGPKETPSPSHWERRTTKKHWFK